MRFVFILVFLFATQQNAAAQYCASYYDGTKSCGIPTLQACEQSVLGVGGVCVNDDSAQLGPPIKGPFQRMFDRAAEQDAEYGKPSSPALDDVPPPPGN
jgi:hypothetical protein